MSGLAAGEAGGSQVVVACDVGGTGIKAGLVDVAGRVSHARTVPTPVVEGDGDATAKAILDQVAGLARQLAGAAPASGAPAGVGVIVPGLVDPGTGMARYAENLGWRDVPFVDRLAGATGLPVAFDHDVRAAGAAEQRFGAGRGYRDVAFVPIGTGISAALVLDTRPYAGGGWAGEIGHIDVGSGLPCPCGARGCLETVASAASIARRYTERSGRPVEGALEVASLLGTSAGSCVGSGSGSEDADARAVWDEAVNALAFVLAVTAGVAAPKLIIIGGGLSGAGPVLLEPLRKGVARRVTPPQRQPELVLAALGEQAGLLGAALLAWEKAGVTMQGPPGRATAGRPTAEAG